MMKVARIVMLLSTLHMLPMFSFNQDAVSNGAKDPVYRRGLTMITPAEQWREALLSTVPLVPWSSDP